MRAAVAFPAIAALAFAAGATLWWLGRPPPAMPESAVPAAAQPTISGAALYAAAFRDAQGRPQSLGQFEGRPLVLNFWATWCAPCREEMPAFVRLNREFAGRVAFVGISSEAPDVVARFGRELAIDYPLWTGGAEVESLSARLGDSAAVLPFTALIDPSGRVVTAKVGPYTEGDLRARLATITGNPG
ncbi:MAG TPA: TlpA disulfide reductase family protein [Usitatibacter sp.]|jgi:thiol-disulfide isomerase/thioredoxin|nr:TlpA disulfide reductase family protein [Usitatibacter sp.]